MQKKHLLFPLLAGLALLLTACPGPGGNGTGTRDQVTVRLQDPGGGLVAAYYRVGSGAWQQLSFQSGQASFPAQGVADYEVAVRCAVGAWGGVPELQFFKASTSNTRQVSLVCSQNQPTPGVSFTLRVQAPASIGGVALQEGDAVFATGRGTAGILQQGGGGLEATLDLDLPAGQQTLVVAILRDESMGGNPSVRPIGAKVVSANVTPGGTLTVDASGWQPLTAKAITASVPAGFQGAGFVAHFRNGMKGVTITGIFDRYGVIPDGRGVYLGLFQAVNADYSQEIFLVKETGGGDWAPDVPAPWAQGGFTVANGTLTFRYAGAQGFGATLWGLAADRDSGISLRVGVSVFAQGNTTAYTLPNLEQQLGYTLTPGGGGYYEVAAILRGMTDEGASVIFDPAGEPTEALLRGLDLALVRLRGSLGQ